MTDLSQPDPHMEAVTSMNKDMKTTTFHVTLTTEQYTRLLTLCMMLELPAENILSVGIDRVYDDVQEKMAEAVLQTRGQVTPQPGLLGRTTPEDRAIDRTIAQAPPEPGEPSTDKTTAWEPPEQGDQPEPTPIKADRPKGRRKPKGASDA